MDAIVRGWNRFWFAPESTAALGLVRIAVGLLCLLWALSLLPDLFTFFSSDGLVTRQPVDQAPGVWGLFAAFPSHAALVVAYVALLVGSLALMLGFWTRLAGVVVFLGLLSFDRRNPFVLNSGDGLVRILALFVALAPAGAALSLDRWRRDRQRFWDHPARAPWALRLIQVQLSVLYISTVWQKVRGTTWNDGSAVSYALRLEDLERFPVPSVLTQSDILANIQTYATLGVELSLGILVWNRVLRPWVLLAGVGLHLSIDYSVRVGFFSYAILAAYLAFVPAATAERFITFARGRLSGLRLPGRGSGGVLVPSPSGEPRHD